MKNIVFILLLNALVATKSNGADLLQRRLELRLKFSPNLCLKLAEKKVKQGSKNPHAYYYTIKIKLDKSNASESLNEKYSLSSSALYYARRFVKLPIDDTSMVKKRADLIRELEMQSIELAKKLNEVNKASKSQRLRSKLAKISPEQKKPPQKVLVKTVDTVPLSVFKGGQYFGMPAGDEIVQASYESREKEMLRIINKARKAKGMGELQWEPGLARAARYHAYDMATQRYFHHHTHDRVNGKLERQGGTFVRIRKFYNATFVNSENIAAGNGGARDTYMQWYNSPGHHRNMFNKASKRVGIGLYYDPASPFKYYWVFCTAK